MSTEGKKTAEIDLVGLLKRVLKETKLLLLTGIGFAVLGVIIALNKPKTYTTTVVLAPESQDAGSGAAGGLSSLTSAFGIKMGVSGGADAIYPELYPEVFASTDFLLTLFDIPVQTSENKETKTYFEHLVKDAKIPFWDYPKVWLGKLFQKKSGGEAQKKINPFHLTREQLDVCRYISSLITCTVDKKTSIITIKVTDFDPLVAAVMADTTMNRLQAYITQYRTSKARNDLAYMEKLNAEALADYQAAQKRYVQAADANQEVVLPSAQTKIEDLENEMQLKYNAYTSVAQGLQLAKQKVQERTPAFTIIQGASVPLEASSTPRSYVVLATILFGLCCAAVWILLLKPNLSLFSRKKREDK